MHGSLEGIHLPGIWYGEGTHFAWPIHTYVEAVQSHYYQVSVRLYGILLLLQYTHFSWPSLVAVQLGHTYPAHTHGAHTVLGSVELVFTTLPAAFLARI